MKENLDIAFAVNDSFAQHCCVAIASVLHNNPHFNCRFHILSDYLSPINVERLSTMPARFGGGHSVEIIVVDNALFSKFKIHIECVTVQTYYRLVLAHLLADIDRVLYLDTDLVVDGSLSELWSMDLDGMLCAGVIDRNIEMLGHKYTIGLTSDDVYVNAGVLLMNLKEMRRLNITEQMMSITDEMMEIFTFQDQDIVNLTMRGKIACIPLMYNFATLDKLDTSAPKPVIIHYTSTYKPWTIYVKCGHILVQKYFKYLAMTPYSSFVWRFRLGRIDRRIKKICGKNIYAIKG